MDSMVKIQTMVILMFLCISYVLGVPSHPRTNVIDKRSSKRATRSTGGSAATIEDHPYVASVYVDYSLVCGASILTDLHVLSAAHCLDEYKTERFSVGIGSEKYRSSLRIPIAKIKLHESFKPDAGVRERYNYTFDVAIARLGRKIQFGPTVSPVCLHNSVKRVRVGAVASVLGWGDTDETGITPESLREVMIPIVPTSECISKFPESFHIKSLYAITCAGAPGRGVCSGDSGGPLMIEGRQAGIASLTQGCPGSVGYYTTVPMYFNWIKKTVREFGGPSKLPTNHCKTTQPLQRVSTVGPTARFDPALSGRHQLGNFNEW